MFLYTRAPYGIALPTAKSTAPSPSLQPQGTSTTCDNGTDPLHEGWQPSTAPSTAPGDESKRNRG
ncbi:hypothetical protein BT67DRAFT_443289 [Trichocladium antarcticum]|uniref:Uncharacterized protein n=1 Tax=Trichocladium antarcticum TaxID=1450529 RepID=A0AAN6UH33_9PEZI|nr:hypothetical protein BT67DRAFT_443289 [Trichocladium antarcticum]